MASVFNRGTRARPRWYAKYRNAGNTWKMSPTRQPTRAEAMRVAQALEAQAYRERLGIEKRPTPELPLCGALMARWLDGDVVKPGQPRGWGGLTNRSARGDSQRVRRHLVPRFADVRLADITPQYLIRWLHEMKATAEFAESTQRVHLNLLSRFFGWCVVQGLATTNPVQAIPSRQRPQQTPKDENAPWLQDDGTVLALMRAMPAPFDLMLYLANRSGLRPGELCGLRMSDLAHLADGCIRVRHSYAGPLKEDKRSGKAKWCPAADDSVALLGPWLERRRADGAGDEDLVFVHASGPALDYDDILHAWKPARESLGLTLSFNQAGRHSFCSRNLSRDVALDQVAAAMGHSSTAVTSRNYDHFIKKFYPPAMRVPLVDGPGPAEKPKREADA